MYCVTLVKHDEVIETAYQSPKRGVVVGNAGAIFEATGQNIVDPAGNPVDFHNLTHAQAKSMASGFNNAEFKADEPQGMWAIVQLADQQVPPGTKVEIEKVSALN